MIKNGGNVAGYFRYADGRVLHAVAGPVAADELLAESQWALELIRQLKMVPEFNQSAAVQQAHRQAVSDTTNAATIHGLLVTRPLPSLETFYPQVFEGILGETVRRDDVRIVSIQEQIRVAQSERIPMVFIIGPGAAVRGARGAWDQSVRALNPRLRHRLLGIVEGFQVVELRRDELPAVSQLLGDRPFSLPAASTPVLVVATSRGQQVGTAIGYADHAQLLKELVAGLAQEAADSLPATRLLTQILSEPGPFPDVESLIVSGILRSVIAEPFDFVGDEELRRSHRLLLVRLRKAAQRFQADRKVLASLQQQLQNISNSL